jgi:hypothetical protein
LARGQRDWIRDRRPDIGRAQIDAGDAVHREMEHLIDEFGVEQQDAA